MPAGGGCGAAQQPPLALLVPLGAGLVEGVQHPGRAVREAEPPPSENWAMSPGKSRSSRSGVAEARMRRGHRVTAAGQSAGSTGGGVDGAPAGCRGPAGSVEDPARARARLPRRAPRRPAVISATASSRNSRGTPGTDGRSPRARCAALPRSTTNSVVTAGTGPAAGRPARSGRRRRRVRSGGAKKPGWATDLAAAVRDGGRGLEVEQGHRLLVGCHHDVEHVQVVEDDARGCAPRAPPPPPPAWIRSAHAGVLGDRRRVGIRRSAADGAGRRRS